MSASILMRCETPLGACLLLGDARALRGLWFEGAAHYARTLPPDAREGSTPALRDAVLTLRLGGEHDLRALAERLTAAWRVILEALK